MSWSMVAEIEKKVTEVANFSFISAALTINQWIPHVH